MLSLYNILYIAKILHKQQQKTLKQKKKINLEFIFKMMLAAGRQIMRQNLPQSLRLKVNLNENAFIAKIASSGNYKFM